MSPLSVEAIVASLLPSDAQTTLAGATGEAAASAHDAPSFSDHLEQAVQQQPAPEQKTSQQSAPPQANKPQRDDAGRDDRSTTQDGLSANSNQTAADNDSRKADTEPPAKKPSSKSKGDHTSRDNHAAEKRGEKQGVEAQAADTEVITIQLAALAQQTKGDKPAETLPAEAKVAESVSAAATADKAQAPTDTAEMSALAAALAALAETISTAPAAATPVEVKPAATSGRPPANKKSSTKVGADLAAATKATQVASTAAIAAAATTPDAVAPQVTGTAQAEATTTVATKENSANTTETPLSNLAANVQPLGLAATLPLSVTGTSTAEQQASKADGTDVSAIPSGDKVTDPTASASPTNSTPATPAFALPGSSKLNATSGGRHGEGEVMMSQGDRARFVERVSGAFRAAEQNGSPVRLRLSPPELGSMRIEIRIDQGQMHARIETETPQARSLLVDNLSALRDRLEQQDIKVARFDIGLMNQSGGGPTQNSDGRWQQGDALGRATRSAAVPISAEAAVATVSTTAGNFSQGVNVLI